MKHCSAVSGPTGALDTVLAGHFELEQLAVLTRSPVFASSTLDALALQGGDGSSFTGLLPTDPAGPLTATAVDRGRGTECMWMDDRCIPLMDCPDRACVGEKITCESCDGIVTRPVWVGVGTCPLEGPDDLGRRVTFVSMRRACRDTDCGCSPDEGVVDHVPAEAFPSLRVTGADGARLQVAALADGNGYCVPVIAPSDTLTGLQWGHAFDATLGVSCHPAMTADGVRCVPDNAYLGRPTFSEFRDAACTQPVEFLTEGSWGVPRFGYDVATNAYYERGPMAAGTYYRMAGTCIPVTAGIAWELGPRAEPSFEPLVDQID